MKCLRVTLLVHIFAKESCHKIIDLRLALHNFLGNLQKFLAVGSSLHFNILKVMVFVLICGTLIFQVFTFTLFILLCFNGVHFNLIVRKHFSHPSAQIFVCFHARNQANCFQKQTTDSLLLTSLLLMQCFTFFPERNHSWNVIAAIFSKIKRMKYVL